MSTASLDLLNRKLDANDAIACEDYEQRLSEVASLWQRGDYDQVIRSAEGMLRDGIYDIRLIVYVLYGHYVHTGPAQLAPLLQCLNRLLHENREVLRPIEKQEMHIRKSVTLFCNKVHGKLTRDEKKSSALAQWKAGMSLDVAEETVDALQALQTTLTTYDDTAEEPVPDTIGKLITWFTELRDTIRQETEDLMLTASPQPAPEDEECEAPPVALTSQPLETEVLIHAEESYPLQLLLKKLAIFEKLIAGDEMKKAAIVLVDIRAELANFDPRRYFPKLFTRFSALQAAHIQELAAFEMASDTMEWRTLEEYYQVDMDGFLTLDV